MSHRISKTERLFDDAAIAAGSLTRRRAFAVIGRRIGGSILASTFLGAIFVRPASAVAVSTCANTGQALGNQTGFTTGTCGATGTINSTLRTAWFAANSCSTSSCTVKVNVSATCTPVNTTCSATTPCAVNGTMACRCNSGTCTTNQCCCSRNSTCTASGGTGQNGAICPGGC